MNNPQILLIGYGNTLRSDDGIGKYVAEKIEKLKIKDVKTIVVHQLLPELSIEISKARMVIFVDALQTEENNEIEVKEIKETSGASIGHSLNPESLLAYSKNLYNSFPVCYSVGIPVTNFEFGEEISKEARKRGNQAVKKIIELIDEFNQKNQK